jgi:hypothetical protein
MGRSRQTFGVVSHVVSIADDERCRLEHPILIAQLIGALEEGNVRRRA